MQASSQECISGGTKKKKKRKEDSRSNQLKVTKGKLFLEGIKEEKQP